MNTTFDGKTVVVTGSTSGIGAGIAEGFASRGANIVLNGLGDPAAIEAQRAELEEKYGIKAAYADVDLMLTGCGEKLITAAEDAFGSVDIVVNNAGMQHVCPVEDFPDDKWDMLINLNLTATFRVTKAALPGMLKRGFGRIINIASAHGLVASPFKSAYVAAKHGVVGFTKSAALEVAEAGDITVNAICPGYVRTPLVEGQIADQAAAHGKSEEEVIRDVILATHPNKRFVTIEELSETAAMLAGPNGRSFNGASIAIDGGWTIR